MKIKRVIHQNIQALDIIFLPHRSARFIPENLLTANADKIECDKRCLPLYRKPVQTADRIIQRVIIHKIYFITTALQLQCNLL